MHYRYYNYNSDGTHINPSIIVVFVISIIFIIVGIAVLAYGFYDNITYNKKNKTYIAVFGDVIDHEIDYKGKLCTDYKRTNNLL